MVTDEEYDAYDDDEYYEDEEEDYDNINDEAENQDIIWDYKPAIAVTYKPEKITWTNVGVEPPNHNVNFKPFSTEKTFAIGKEGNYKLTLNRPITWGDKKEPIMDDVVQEEIVYKPYNPAADIPAVKDVLAKKLDIVATLEEEIYYPKRIYRHVPAVDQPTKIKEIESIENQVKVKKKVTQYTDADHIPENKNEDQNGTIVDPYDPNANLITSLCENGNHAPVIDFDFPIHVYPSSQLGHYHLYINKEISKDDYDRLLRLLAEIGLIEEGYADASVKKGWSGVRPVGVVKIDAPKGKDILIENARFKQYINQLQDENNHLKEKLTQDTNVQLQNEKNLLLARVEELENALKEQNEIMATQVGWA